MNNGRTSLYFVTAILCFSISAPGLAAGTAYEFLTNEKLALCSGSQEKIETAKKELSAAIEKDPADIRAILLRDTFLDEDQVATISKYLNKISNHEQPASEVDRLMYAYATVYSGHGNPSNIGSYLDFESKNKSIESERLMYTAMLEYLNGHVKEAFESYKKSYDASPIPRAGILAAIFDFGRTPEVDGKEVTPYSAELQKILPQDPDKTEAEFTKGKWEKTLTPSQGYKILDEAHKRCPADRNITERLISENLEMHYFDTAYDLIMKSMGKNKFYWVGLNLKAADAALVLGKTDETKKFIDLTKDSILGKSPIYQPHIARLVEHLEKAESKRRASYFAWAIVAFLSFGAVRILLRIKKRLKPIVADLDEGEIDYKALAEAEENLANQPEEEFVTLGNFRTEDGYREASIVDLVADLNANGIVANFSVATSFYTPSFTVTVLASQADEARAFVAKRFSKK